MRKLNQHPWILPKKIIIYLNNIYESAAKTFFFHPQVEKGTDLFKYVFILSILWITVACSGINSKNSNNDSQRNTLLLALLLQEPEKEINVNGLTRKYLDFVPSSLPEDPPILFVLHGSGASATKFKNSMGATLERMAVKENFIIAYLSGYEGHFNDCRKMGPYSAKKLNIDDKSFVKVVAEKLRAETGKKLSKLYALGYSNGAQMAYRLAIEENFIDGIIAVSANIPALENMDCVESITKPHPRVAIIQGTRDPINPTEGGQVGGAGTASRGRVLSTRQSAEWFATKYELENAPVEKKFPTKRAQLSGALVWEKEDEGIMMVLLDGYGHTIPQEFSPFPLALGATYQDNSILENAWKFISQK
jgi:polyhydroxybutyrate depolymerase